MCDIYSEPCKRCGKAIPMHLGDFATNRTEIFAVCQECMTGEYNPTNRHTMRFNSVLWKSERDLWEKDPAMRNNSSGEFDFVLVIALTENAWKNLDSNHPNIWPTEELLIIPVECAQRDDKP